MMSAPHHHPLQVAIQGGVASFHDIAARGFFLNRALTVLPCRTFRLVCQLVAGGKTDFGILAIENSVAGCILPNYALLREFPLVITGEYYLPIHHHLMALPGERLEDIRMVRSHPMALAQCSEFLEKFPDMAQIESEDTAESAREISTKQEKGVAAIASLQAADLFGMQILAGKIENQQANYTRFFVLAVSNPLRSDADKKASLSFRIGHRVGSLAEVLNVFRQHRINLTLIQSVPITGIPDEYHFQVDVEWEIMGSFDAALAELAHHTQEIKVFGIYPPGLKPWEQSAEK